MPTSGLHCNLGQPDRAADEADEIARLRPSSYYFGSAIQSIRFASRFSEAKSWLAKADALKLDNSVIRHERLIVAFATGDPGSTSKRSSRRRSEATIEKTSCVNIPDRNSAGSLSLRRPSAPASFGANLEGWQFYWWVVLSALEDAEAGKDVQARRYESEASSKQARLY